MRLEDFISESTDIKKQWLQYVKSNPMLKAGVEVMTKIETKGSNAWVVGGAVRDIVLGTNPKDIDIATNMKMDELEKIFKTYDVGSSRDFGIVVVNHKGFQFEIAMLRGETYQKPKTVRKITKLGPPEPYDTNNPDHKDPTKYEVVAYESSGRRPTGVTFDVDLKGDMARRDLQVNAMAIDLDGNIIDHFDGIKAIRDKVLKTVGDPNKRFEEDYLRQLRVVRFAGKLGFDIDPKTADAIKTHKDKLTGLSPERIKDEIWKMASQSGDKFANSLRLMDTLGILDIILPEVSLMKTTKETESHHPEAYEQGDGSVFDHVMAALKANKTKDPIVNLSVLLHDVGKPKTFNKVGDRNTYFGHAEEAKDIIDVIAKRLKLSNKEKNSITFAAMNHMKLFKGGEMKPSKIMKLVNDENWALLKAVSFCDDSCRTGLFDKKKFDATIKNMEDISQKWGSKTVNKVAKVVDGERVLRLTKERPGKLIGDIIAAVTDEVLSKNVKSDKEIDVLIMKYYKELK